MSSADPSEQQRVARIARIVLVFFGLGLGFAVLGLLEWGVRSQLGIYRCDEDLGWTFRPESSGIKLNRHGEFFERVAFNAQGYRDDAEIAPSEGGYRFLLLGDSIAASLQVSRDGTFDSILERRLGEAASPGRSIEIVNTGTDGYSSAQELLLLRGRGQAYRPNAVMLQLYISNDLVDNFHAAGNWNHYLAQRCGRPYFELSENGVTQRSKPVPPETSGWGRLLQYSQLYSSIIAPPKPAGSGPAFEIQDVFSVDPPPELEEAWALTQALITAIQDEARRRGMRFLVVVAPSKQAVGQIPPAQRDLPRRWRQGHDRLVAFLRDRTIPYVDLLPALIQQFETGERKPYFEIDSHWTVEGHRVVADALYDWLVDHCAELALPLDGCGQARGRALP